MRANWNEDWYTVLRKIAYKVLRMNSYLDLQVDELINEAWIDTVRRLDPDSDLKLVASCAKMSMRQYCVGGKPCCKNRKSTIKYQRLEHRDWDGQWVETSLARAREPSLTYDDVDEVLTRLSYLTPRTKKAMLLLLAGYTQKVVSEKIGTSESLVSMILKRAKRERKLYD